MRMILVALLLTLGAAQAAPASYQLDPRHTKVGFTIGHFGSSAEGRFETVQGQLRFDPDQPEASSIQVQIEVASVDTGIPKRDRHILQPDYFHAEQHPTIVFKSQNFRDLGNGRYRILGELTMRGVTKAISFPVSLERRQSDWLDSSDRLVFEADLELDRQEFGVSGGQPAVSREVQIHLHVEAVRP